jgi:hypothetical protein
MDWLVLAEFDVRSGSLWAGDPFMANVEDGYVAPLRPGRYRLEIQRTNDDAEIHRLRVVRGDIREPHVGVECGETGTDSASIAVCDLVWLDQLLPDPDAVSAQIDAQLRGAEWGVAHLGPAGEVPLVYVATGSDGTGPVFDLWHEGESIGFMLDFMPEA